MVFRVTGAYETKTKVDIVLPYTESGEPAFTPDGTPIKDVEPITLSLPLYNYLPQPELKELMKAAAEIDGRELSDDYNAFDRQRDSILESLRPFLSDGEYTVAAMLTLGELVEINGEWARRSAMPLGESSASNGSSKSTRRPSNTTSSATASA